MKRLLVTIVFLIALTGCTIGSYRGIRVAEKGKWEYTPYIGENLGVKFAYGVLERSEVEFGLFVVGASVGGKYLILDEKTSDDFMSLAISGGANAPILSFGSGFIIPVPKLGLEFLNLDLSLIGGKTFGEYTEDNLPGNTYLGLGVRYFPIIGALIPVSGRQNFVIAGRGFVGGEIPISTEFMLTPELSLVYPIGVNLPFPLIPTYGLGLTFKP